MSLQEKKHILKQTFFSKNTAFKRQNDAKVLKLTVILSNWQHTAALNKGLNPLMQKNSLVDEEHPKLSVIKKNKSFP